MREVAYRVPIKLIWMGNYVKSDEQYKPNYVEVSGMMINRVNILGVVVDRYDSDANQYSSLTLDDGTAQIRAKFFGEETRFLKGIDVGDTVRVIGKVKESETERYIVGEIARKLEDPRWQTLWKLEVLDKYKDLIDKNEEKEKTEKDDEKKEKERERADKDIKEEKKKERGKDEKSADEIDELEIEEIEV